MGQGLRMDMLGFNLDLLYDQSKVPPTHTPYAHYMHTLCTPYAYLIKDLLDDQSKVIPDVVLVVAAPVVAVVVAAAAAVHVHLGALRPVQATSYARTLRTPYWLSTHTLRTPE